MWRHTMTTSGYGKIMINGVRYPAHRLSWLMFRGEIPEGKWVLHTCDSKLCVNPDHLYLGVHGDNVQDVAVRGKAGPPRKGYSRAMLWALNYLGDDHVLTPQELRTLATMLDKYSTYEAHRKIDARRYGDCRAWGERHGSAKLTEQQVQQIRDRRAKNEAARTIALDFGISEGQVYAIGKGKSWKRVLSTFQQAITL